MLWMDMDEGRKRVLLIAASILAARKLAQMEKPCPRLDFCIADSVASPPSVRWAAASECETGAETVRFNIADGLHWFSGAAISFARGLNDTPKSRRCCWSLRPGRSS